MFGNPVGSGLTLSKVISGISKTLSIANQVIPLYREAKPMINNAKTIFSVLKDLNTTTPKTPKHNTTINKPKKETASTPSVSLNTKSNTPQFFL